MSITHDENAILLRHAVTAFLFLAVTVLVESYSNIDMILQRTWWNEDAAEWLISKSTHAEWRWIFYGGAKKAVAICGGAAFAAGLAGFFFGKSPLLRGGLLVLASLVLVPMLVGLLKMATNVYCPYELIEFGGNASYQHLLEMANPANAPICRGNCFPAGHASGGFGLLMLFFCIRGRLRWLGFAAGLAAGWTMGLYQMLRGDHFLTHTMATMFLAWGVCALLVLLWNHYKVQLIIKYRTDIIYLWRKHFWKLRHSLGA